ncbi:hypothetical protein bmyco0002_45690 [Bacillus pseudomycoides]|nr:hypothetical protein bmyco0002_45690 [Bacillus pseudomycoides]
MPSKNKERKRVYLHNRDFYVRKSKWICIEILLYQNLPYF